MTDTKGFVGSSSRTRQGLYVSNQTRQRRYRKERDDEDQNSEVVQMRLYTKLAEDADDDFKASNLAAMASRVGTKISQNAEDSTTRKPENNGGDAASGFSKLLMAIQNGKLNEFIQAITKIPNMQGEQLAVQVALKTPAVKTEFNDKVATLIERKEVKPKKVADALIQSIMKSKLFQKGARETGSAEVSEAGSEVGEKSETSSVNGSEESEETKRGRLASQAGVAIGDTAEAVKKALGKVSDGVNPELAGESSLFVPPSQAPTISSSIDQLMQDYPEMVHWGFTETEAFKKQLTKIISTLGTEHYVEIIIKPKEGKILDNATPRLYIDSDGVSLKKKVKTRSGEVKFMDLTSEEMNKIKHFKAQNLDLDSIQKQLSEAAE